MSTKTLFRAISAGLLFPRRESRCTSGLICGWVGLGGHKPDWQTLSLKQPSKKRNMFSINNFFTIFKLHFFNCCCYNCLYTIRMNSLAQSWSMWLRHMRWKHDVMWSRCSALSDQCRGIWAREDEQTLLRAVLLRRTHHLMAVSFAIWMWTKLERHLVMLSNTARLTNFLCCFFNPLSFLLTFSSHYNLTLKNLSYFMYFIIDIYKVLRSCD